MSDENTETCFEYFNCKELNCIRRDNLDKNCWDIDDVQCQSHSKEFQRIKNHLNNKLKACKLCIYYQIHNKNTD